MATKKLVRSKSGLRMIACDKKDEDISPLFLPEPPWVPDNECYECMGCDVKFDMMKRRHHCRRCGKCYCGTCCEQKLPLPRMSFVDPVRMCAACSEITRKENDFFNRQLKTLTSGGSFVLTDSDDIAENSDLVSCCLSNDHKCVLVDFSDGNNASIPLRGIDSLQILTSGVDPLGNAVGTGLAIRYNSEGLDYTIKLLVAPTSRKPSMAWIAAMQKAMKLICDCRTDSP